MTTTTANIKKPALENLAPQDALDFALIIGETYYTRYLDFRVTMDELDAIRAPWLALPVDYANPSYIYDLLHNGATIRQDSGLTDAELIDRIKGALMCFIDSIEVLNARGAQ